MEQNRIDSPLGIYVHIPFCEKKCFYCDFYSIENHSQRDEFIASLVSEIGHFSSTHPKLKADTIFLGGGTPSFLKPQEVEQLLKALHEAFDISDQVEFTMECNPGTVDTAHLSEYRQLGVNRISFGVQSFFDDELKFLQRIHTSQEAVEAFDKARKVGFENINIDLMYALPDQPVERHLTNLGRAILLNPTHLSIYALIVEQGTSLYSAVAGGEIQPADDETEAAMYEATMSFLTGTGYTHYEVSNYSKPGRECRHNLKYWNSQDYIGFGPSAHSHLEKDRWWNVSSLKDYISRTHDKVLPIASRETLTQSQILDEFVFLNLRQGKLDLNQLHAKFMFDPDAEFVSKALEAGYFKRSDGILYLSNKGFTVCDEIAKEILTKAIEGRYLAITAGE